jgi:hypothetical protein
MMEAVRTSETSVDNHFTRQYIPEGNSEQKRSGVIHSCCYIEQLLVVADVHFLSLMLRKATFYSA